MGNDGTVQACHPKGGTGAAVYEPVLIARLRALCLVTSNDLEFQKIDLIPSCYKRLVRTVFQLRRICLHRRKLLRGGNAGKEVAGPRSEPPAWPAHRRAGRHKQLEHGQQGSEGS